MNFEIKKARADDLITLNQVLRLSKAYWGYDKSALDRFMEKLGFTIEGIENSQTYLVYAHKKMIGFYGFATDKDGQTELNNFFLHPDFIGKNLGRKLWDLCCATAKNMDIHEFLIWSDPHAEGFYLKMGCKKIGSKKSVTLENSEAPILKYFL